MHATAIALARGDCKHDVLPITRGRAADTVSSSHAVVVLMRGVPVMFVLVAACSGSSGHDGFDAAPACTGVDGCAAPTECIDVTCEAGHCKVTPKAMGVELAEQTAGD